MKLLGFFPDFDEHTEGLVTNCEMLVPTEKGYKGAESLTSTAYAALATSCRGAATLTKLDGTTRFIAGVQTKLWEGAGGSWTDVTAVSDYIGSASSKWRFAQFGDVSLATNKVDALQKSVTSGDFSALSGAPKASMVETVAGFVMVADYNDGTDTPDGWYCSAFEDYTNWTPSIATQCANGRLFDTPGKITGLRRIGKDCVIYKENAVYLGQWVAGDVIWAWSLISGEIGAVSQEGIVSIETAHFFVGMNDIWVFDGTRPASIGEGIKKWFFNDLNMTYRNNIIGAHDKERSLVYFYYPDTTSSGECNACIVYNYKTRKWGRANRTIEAAVEWISGGYTYTSLAAAFTTYADLPAVAYDSPFWRGSTINVAVFDSAHTLKTLSGESSTSSLTGNWFGDGIKHLHLQRVIPQFINDATSATLTNYYRDTYGVDQTTGATTDMSRARFSIFWRARFHKVKMAFTGAHEITGYIVQAVEAGKE